MKAIQNFEELIDHLARRDKPSRVAVVCPYDETTQGAVAQAMEAGFVDPVLVGETEKMGNALPGVPRVDASDDDDAAARAVALVRQGQADVLMKGLLNTDNCCVPCLIKRRAFCRRGVCSLISPVHRCLSMTNCSS